jgi:hypothetical protein
MANRYAPLPKGLIWVPTPTGRQAMTLDQARQYQAAHQSAVTDPNNPNLSPDIRAKLQDPQVRALIQQGGTGVVQVGDSKVRVENGQATGWETGGKWKPILLAGAVATLGIAGPALAGGGGTAASTSAPVTAGGGGAAGTTAALGPSTAANMAATQAVVGGSTVPASLAAPAATGGGFSLGGVGRFLSSPGGATALGVAGQLGGAAIQSSGISKAAEIEAQFQREALQYEKQRDQYLQQLEANRYGELTQRLQPYMSMGTTTGDALAQMLGVNPASYQYGTAAGADSGGAAVPNVTPHMPGAPLPIPPGYDQRGPGTPGSNPTGVAVPRGGGGPATPAGGLVTVRAPTGEQRQLPPDQAQQAVAKGAQIVSG